jgi:hypothetical protein
MPRAWERQYFPGCVWQRRGWVALAMTRTWIGDLGENIKQGKTAPSDGYLTLSHPTFSKTSGPFALHFLQLRPIHQARSCAGSGRFPAP